MKRDELKRMLESAGIRPRRPLGQNFLTDPNLVKAIARDAEIEPTDVVLEVGTGTAGLTQHLADAAAFVVGVEIDAALAELTRERMVDRKNFTLLERDVLASKAKIADEVIDTVRRELAARPGARLRFVANLPYSIATLVVVHMLELDLPLVRCTVMVQMESAERFAAQPGDPTFNSVSVLCSQLATSKVLRKIPPAVFFPRPKISSAVVQLDPLPVRGLKDPLYVPLRTIARALFNYRRKTLLTAARSATKYFPALAVVEPAFARAGIDPERRAEHLVPEEWRALARECPGLTDVEIEVVDDEPADEEPESGERRKHKNKYQDKSHAPEVEPEIPEDED